MTLTETKAQRWRALVVLHTGAECLLYVNSNYTGVKTNYAEAFSELFQEQYDEVNRILVQKWLGEADRGMWITQGDLPVPVLSE